ncbi:competence type IV pilus minor pilin ComGG [Camelliibacillus cellulosilyticus]|uniref:Competence type IV pilus minor pilin ComGG n=1 Tax=Camelliibacillus cellulosilyticus TaxID=2174486 RepID=A0ABV9GKC3_9BACL
MDCQKHGKINSTPTNRYQVLCGREGFILPIAMIVLLFFSFYVLHTIEMLSHDRGFLKEREVAVINDRLKQMAAYDLTQILSDDSSEGQGTLDYNQGTVTYQITPIGDQNIKVVCEVYQPPDHRSIFQLQINLTSHKIVKWVE